MESTEFFTLATIALHVYLFIALGIFYIKWKLRTSPENIGKIILVPALVGFVLGAGLLTYSLILL
jgi:hypothetical protein